MTENRKMIIVSLLICSYYGGVDALSVSSRARRDALRNISAIGGGITSSAIFLPQASQAATPLPLQSSSGAPVRIEELGSGLDLLSPKPITSEVYYASSMTDTKWRVQRVVTSVEGNLEQSALAWKLLGGSDEKAFTSKLTEVYEADFIAAPEGMKDAAYTSVDGKTLQSAILDRSLELSSRIGIDKGSIQLDAQNNSIEYTRNNNEGPVNLTVVSRKIEPPTESGFGSDEVYRILSSAGGIFAGTNVYRCARVRRRFRRGFDESTGKRILDGIEIVTTHRVMDGVAGIEMPTSTCKTRLRYTQL